MQARGTQESWAPMKDSGDSVMPSGQSSIAGDTLGPQGCQEMQEMMQHLWEGLRNEEPPKSIPSTQSSGHRWGTPITVAGNAGSTATTGNVG